MSIVVFYELLALIGLLALFAIIILVAELRVVNRLTETNKRLLIIVAGQDVKPEALRALVAVDRPPQKELKGIAEEKKKDKKPENTNYTMKIGVNDGL